MNRRRLAPLRMVPAVAYVALLFLFIYTPVVVMVLFSFQDGTLPVPPFLGFSVRWYDQMFENWHLMSSLGNSMIVGLLSALAAVGLAFLAAYGLSHHRLRLSGIIQWQLLAPVTISYLIIALGLLMTFNALGVPKSLLTIGIGHVVINLPLAFAIIYSQMGEQLVNIERAARDLGAAEWQVLLRVTVPMLWPTLFVAFCIALTFSWDEFIIAFLLGRFAVTLPVEIWAMLRRGLDPETNAVGSFVFGVSIIITIVAASVVFFGLRRRKTNVRPAH